MSKSTTTKSMHFKVAPSGEASEPMTQRLVELSASAWTADASGALQSVCFGVQPKGVTPKNVQCNTGVAAPRHALDGNAEIAVSRSGVASGHTTSEEKVIVEGLHRIAIFLNNAVNTGTKSLQVFVDCAALLGYAMLETKGACGEAAANIRQLLAQIPSVSLQGARLPSPTLVRQLKNLNASSWQVNSVGFLRWVQFGKSGKSGKRPALAFSDAGIRNGCCTIGGVIRENREMVGLVMERAPDTNNVVLAELLGVTRIMEEALALGIKSVEVRIDCLAVVEHVVRIRDGVCGDAANRIRSLIAQFESVKLSAISRNLNTEADSLATSARDCYETITPELAVVVKPVQSTKAWSMKSIRGLLANIAWPVVGHMA